MISTLDHFLHQVLRIPYEPGEGNTVVSVAIELAFLMRKIYTLSLLCLYIVKALRFPGIS